MLFHLMPKDELLETLLAGGFPGQAVQAMNILFGLPETTGLEQIALAP